MPLLKTVSPEEATGKTAEIYATLKGMIGIVPQAAQLQSVSPVVFETWFNGIGYFMNHPTLNRGLLAFVRMLVSAGTNCKYCIDFNKAMLIQNGVGAEALEAAIQDPQKTPLPDKEKALLLFVLKAVKAPHSVGASDVEALRKLGWTDRDIYDATKHGADMVAGDIMIDTFKVAND